MLPIPLYSCFAVDNYKSPFPINPTSPAFCYFVFKEKLHEWFSKELCMSNFFQNIAWSKKKLTQWWNGDHTCFSSGRLWVQIPPEHILYFCTFIVIIGSNFIENFVIIMHVIRSVCSHKRDNTLYQYNGVNYVKSIGFSNGAWEGDFKWVFSRNSDEMKLM